MKFPYGISDFDSVITEGYYYCDRTQMIPLIENAGKSILFLRPRRFGKTFLLSMLDSYYDINKKDAFDNLFGHLNIGKQPTKRHNQYFILKFDFSCVDSNGTVQDIKQSFYDHVNDRIKGFILYYKDYPFNKIQINENNALSSINSLLSVVRNLDNSIFLLIDEYDNFANELMMSTQRMPEDNEKKNDYNAFVSKDGPLKTLFKAIKSGTGIKGFDRTFITGVSPVVLSDITSGYNIAKNRYHDHKFNDLCGFTEQEVKNCLKKIVEQCGLDKKYYDLAFQMTKTYYNGYKFSLKAKEYVYNPTLSLYFFEEIQENCEFPREMLDDNLAVDEDKIRYITELVQGKKTIFDLSQKDLSLEISQIQKRFGLKDLLRDETKDNQFIASYLYYVGSLTIHDETKQGKLRLKIPNLVMKALYLDRIQKILFPEALARDDGKSCAEKVYTEGNIAPLCTFIEKHYYNVFDNRDYRWANELTTKTTFLSLLYNDLLYTMDSETEIDRNYIDLTMIIRPDKRNLEIYDILIEFKYVSLSSAKLTGEQARSISYEDLEKLPCIKEQMNQAKIQAQNYSKKLNQTYANLRLKSFAVVSLGFERLVWEGVGEGSGL